MERRRLRVGFDARALAFPAGGVRRYVQEVFSRLSAVAPDLDLVGVDPPQGVALPLGVERGREAVRVPTNLARAAVALPWVIGGARLDLFHAPAYTAPLAGRTPTVLTIHDVSYARRPEFYAHPSGPFRQWFYRRSASRAAHIITDSDFSRREIVAAYHIPESRITVVPLGVGPVFTPGGEGEAAGLPSGVRPPYVLHVGDLQPRRDVATALRAVVALRSRFPVGAGKLIQLVCAGGDSGSADALTRFSADAGMPDVLALVGPVPEQDLVRLYRRAVALVYPSLYEGFGLPVLEAMACGIPVIGARAGSIPEVAGDAGILVRAGDSDAMAGAIEALITDPGRRAELRARGLARAATFSWERTARGTLGVYRACLQRSGHPQPSAAP